MALGLVAIVGTPSVGKSTIFNRIIGQKKSIIEEERGVTRDRIYGKASWLTRSFMCVDTGVIELENRPFQEQIRMLALMAIDEADVIIFVVDGKIGVTDDDKLVASILDKSKKPIILAVTKIDSIEHINNIYEFYALGLGDPIATSGMHGIGIGDILDQVISKLPKEESEMNEEAIKFAIIGRPNVGKSSLTNAMLNESRTIVSPISGTTRDAIDTPFTKNGRHYIAIDAEKGIIDQDKHVVGYAMESKKAIIIVVNKWDLVKNPIEESKEFISNIRKQFKFLDYAPIIFSSAINKTNIGKIFTEIDKVYESFNFEIKTSTLNDIIQEAQLMNETPSFNGGRVKIYYAQQVGTKPMTIALFVNEPKWMHFSYLRYIENKIRSSFELEGSPINLVLRKRK